MKPHPTFSRRAYPVARYTPTPARVLPVVGLITGNRDIEVSVWTGRRL